MDDVPVNAAVSGIKVISTYTMDQNYYNNYLSGIPLIFIIYM